MPRRVYVVKAKHQKRIAHALEDDVVSRQSVQVRDARHFGRREDVSFVFVEGSDAGVVRADAVFLDFASRASDEDDLFALLREEDEAAASSLGSILRGFD